MIKCFAIAVCLGVTVAVTLPAAAAPPAAQSPPDACKTFTVKSLDKLLGIPTSKHPKEAPYSGATSSSCTVTYKKVSFGVNVSTTAPQSGSPVPSKYYKRPKLGKGGEIIVSKRHYTPRTGAQYQKKGFWILDNVSVTLPKKGQRMYKFALAQSKRFKG